MKVFLEGNNKYACSNKTLLFESNNVEFSQFLKYRNKYYIIVRQNVKDNYSFVEEVTLNQNPKDYYYEHNIKCPYCGYEDQDSWEASEKSDNKECDQCGSIFSYQREIIVHYNSQPIKMSPIINIED